MGSSCCSSVQALLVRQIQVENGQAPCYATVARDSCLKTDCCWRSDCYFDGEAFPSDGAGSAGEVVLREPLVNFYQAGE